MDEFQREALRVRLEAERVQLNALRQAYTQSLKDIKLKILQLEQRHVTPGTKQSIAYQLGYAQAMEKQLTEILGKLNNGVVASVDEYLKGAYQDGFYGTAYTLHGQGIPISMGVDQRAMGEAVKVRTDDLNFSERLYKENLGELKTRYLSTLARGIGSGWNYDKIAMSLALDTGISLRRAYTIARTEGARVYATARQHGMEAAKARGADIVKEWSASLDHFTRPLHGRLDGQIREIEEPFEIEGMTAMRPLGFGVKAMDINCRCVALERARWAVEAEKAGEGGQRTKWDGEAGKVVPYQPYPKWLEGYKAEHPEAVTSQLAKAAEVTSSKPLSEQLKEDTYVTENINPQKIMPLNNVTNQDMYNALVYDFEQGGFSGRPIVAVEMGGNEYQALTGSHRIYAARTAGINIPTKTIGYDDNTRELLDAMDDEERATIAKKLYKAGKIDNEAFRLLTGEGNVNNEESNDATLEVIRQKSKLFQAQQAQKKVAAEAERLAEEAYAKEEAKRKAAEKVESPAWQAFRAFDAELKAKYGADMWSRMTGSEMDKYEDLESKAHRS